VLSKLNCNKWVINKNKEELGYVSKGKKICHNIVNTISKTMLGSVKHQARSVMPSLSRKDFWLKYKKAKTKAKGEQPLDIYNQFGVKCTTNMEKIKHINGYFSKLYAKKKISHKAIKSMKLWGGSIGSSYKVAGGSIHRYKKKKKY